MIKKSKYRLFSYLIENYLIYYKSIRKKSKIISFALLKSQNYTSVESVLNDLLRNRIIQYYSIQIENNNNTELLILLNFEEDKKEKVIKAFNFVKQKLDEINKPISFLREKVLEEKLFTIIFQEHNSNGTIKRSSDSILISSNNKSKILSFFTIDFKVIENKISFLSNFLNLITDIGEIGFLILHFRIENGEDIRFYPYFILESRNNKIVNDFENKVNNFFHSSLLKRHNMKIKTFCNIIWRLGINHTSFSLNDYYDLFFSKNLSYSSDFLEINESFEDNLIKNQIEYIRLSQNLLFIEQRYIFLILENLDSEYIYKIIEKYYSKYFIYILVSDNLANKELDKIKSIKLIESIKIVNRSEIRDFDYKEFKTNGN
ncbi:MAG: hypothetical protein ACFFDF_09045 [Candidatus Odinarchaeota archaeon]